MEGENILYHVCHTWDNTLWLHISEEGNKNTNIVKIGLLIYIRGD